MKRLDTDRTTARTQPRTVLAGEDLALTSGGGAGCCPPIRPTCRPAIVLCAPPPPC
jgi:hypothetical protein